MFLTTPLAVVQKNHLERHTLWPFWQFSKSFLFEFYPVFSSSYPFPHSSYHHPRAQLGVAVFLHYLQCIPLLLGWHIPQEAPLRGYCSFLLSTVSHRASADTTQTHVNYDSIEVLREWVCECSCLSYISLKLFGRKRPITYKRKPALLCFTSRDEIRYSRPVSVRRESKASTTISVKIHTCKPDSHIPRLIHAVYARVEYAERVPIWILTANTSYIIQQMRYLHEHNHNKYKCKVTVQSRYRSFITLATASMCKQTPSSRKSALLRNNSTTGDRHWALLQDAVVNQ